MEPHTFAVIGGDMRQVKLASLLAKDGHQVSAFAMEQARPEGVTLAPTLNAAVADAACVVFPLPLSRECRTISTPLSDTVLTISEAFAALTPAQTVCGGRIDADTFALAADHGLTLLDYYAREELVIANAVATAEGAIQVAMDGTPTILTGTNALVLGFGRIGKVLAHRLRALGVHVTVSARKFADLAWITAYGYRGIPTDTLTEHLPGQQLVFNTIPYLILDAARLRRLDPGTTLIDLSSKPGGIDFSAAAALGLKTIWALGLPGEVAPVSAAAMIRDTIYNILSEQGNSL
ncbi:MAG: dipicolinate synthase subunit DpsA [Oscillospiraceae bacterium]|nr:dipicolinate synthase subunit DpsA [Oscillospiraceae bacterium]